MPAPGEILAREYRLVEKIGEGGMGSVWLAHDEVMRREVAIKVLHEALARDPKASARFRNEARAAARLRHPHICGVIDVGDNDGEPFLVMPRLRGENLASRLQRDTRLPAREAVEVTVAVLRALHAAHTAGILHRDLKPANVFLCEEDGAIVPKILDFGASKIVVPGTDVITRTGVVVGTPAYMAPEQARGERGTDARVDVWGAGALLYEMLSGRLLHEAANAHAMLIKVATHEPRPISQVLPSVDPELASILGRALAFHPDDRFASAWAFLGPLRDWLARMAPHAPASGRTTLPPRTSLRTSLLPTAPESVPRPSVPLPTRIEPSRRPSGTPAVRASLLRTLARRIRAARPGDPALRRPEFERIEASAPHEWVPLDLAIALCARAHELLGNAGLRTVARTASARAIAQALRREAGGVAAPLVSPVSLLVRVPLAWAKLLSACGSVRFASRPSPTEGSVVWESPPLECRTHAAIAEAIAGAIEGVLDVTGTTGSVSTHVRDTKRAELRFVAVWSWQ